MPYMIIQATKFDLFRELYQLVGQEQELGFTAEKLPDRERLINFICYVSSQHRYFQKPNYNTLRSLTIQDIQKLKELNTSIFEQKRLRIFKSSIEQRQKKQADKIKEQIEKVKTQLEEETKKQSEMKGKLQILKTHLINILQGYQGHQRDNLNSLPFQQNLELQEEIYSDQ